MDIHFTARRFKAHKEIRDHAFASLKRLDKFYDGIGRSDIILSYERKPKSIKVVEINLHVNGATLSAKEKAEEFTVSIDLAIAKLIRQLDKFKAKLRVKDKTRLRTLKGEVPLDEESEEE